MASIGDLSQQFKNNERGLLECMNRQQQLFENYEKAVNSKHDKVLEENSELKDAISRLKQEKISIAAKQKEELKKVEAEHLAAIAKWEIEVEDRNSLIKDIEHAYDKLLDAQTAKTEEITKQLSLAQGITKKAK